jgi:methylthioribose-1-phosphate isomerase
MNIKTLLTIILFILLGVAICLVLGYFEVYPFTILWTTVSGWINGFNVEEITSNPTTLITTGMGAVGTAATVGIPLYNKLNSTKQQLEATTQEAKSKISNLTGTLDGATSKLQTTELNLQNATSQLETLKQSSTELQSKADFYKSEFDKLQNRYTELQKIKAADVIGSLPGGTIITNPDGSKSSIIEKVVVK